MTGEAVLHIDYELIKFAALGSKLTDFVDIFVIFVFVEIIFVVIVTAIFIPRAVLRTVCIHHPGTTVRVIGRGTRLGARARRATRAGR